MAQQHGKEAGAGRKKGRRARVQAYEQLVTSWVRQASELPGWVL